MLIELIQLTQKSPLHTFCLKIVRSVQPVYAIGIYITLYHTISVSSVWMLSIVLSASLSLSCLSRLWSKHWYNLIFFFFPIKYCFGFRFNWITLDQRYECLQTFSKISSFFTSSAPPIISSRASSLRFTVWQKKGQECNDYKLQPIKKRKDR